LVTLAITGIAFWKEKTLVQERLNEHRLNKQSKLEQRQEDVENSVYDDSAAYGRTHNTSGGAAGFYEDDEDASPFADQQYTSTTPHNSHQQQEYHSSPFADPHHNASYASQPIYDGNAIPAGQYHAAPPVGFSPMPEPQHMPPHPEPSYYNNQHF
jgi:hypothetical protein